MGRWPWITTVIAAIGAAVPLTHDIFDAAFISSDRWMQDFWRLVFLAGIAILLVVGSIEWGIRAIILRRRAHVPATDGRKTET